MHFYRNIKDGQNYLVLHTNEWDRIKRQSRRPEKPLNEQKEYVKSLNEKSRAWTNTWPDHKHGMVANYDKKQKKLHNNKIAIVEDEEKRQKNKYKASMEAIKEARKKIFDNSCYGRKLLSACRESRTLEERDAQIQFKKQKQKENESKKPEVQLSCTLGLDKYEVEEEKCRKSALIQMNLQNKEMYAKQKEELAETKEMENKVDLENIKMTKEMMALEKIIEEKLKLAEKEARRQYIEDDKKFREERAKSEAECDAKLILIQKEKDERNCKTDRVMKEMCNARDLPWKRQVYENLKQHQEEKRKELEKLLEINNKLAIARSEKRERREREKAIKDREKRILIVEANKLKAKYVKDMNSKAAKAASADRQSLILGDNHHNTLKQRETVKENEGKPLPYFGPCNRLMCALKKRMQQPPPWTGATTAHQEFARNAEEMLRDCKFKRPGRKVINEYIKYSKLDSLYVNI